jgi:hypothetical protein
LDLLTLVVYNFGRLLVLARSAPLSPSELRWPVANAREEQHDKEKSASCRGKKETKYYLEDEPMELSDLGPSLEFVACS